MQAELKMDSRIDMKIDSETKMLAERAAAACGQSLSAYLYSLIRQNAPKVLEEQQKIQLSNQQYNAFIAACEQAENWRLPEKLISEIESMDNEFPKWR